MLSLTSDEIYEPKRYSFLGFFQNGTIFASFTPPNMRGGERSSGKLYKSVMQGQG